MDDVVVNGGLAVIGLGQGQSTVFPLPLYEKSDDVILCNVAVGSISLPTPMSDIAILTERAYDIVRAIPPGRVTSYGHVAKLAGYPNYSRHVGNALKTLPPDSTIPWQRVISSKGTISPRGDSGLGAARQRDRLEAEGVAVSTVGTEERVSLREFGWFPERGEMTLDAWLAQMAGIEG